MSELFQHSEGPKQCPIHGSTYGWMRLSKDSIILGTWCLECLAIALDKAGVSRVEEKECGD